MLQTVFPPISFLEDQRKKSHKGNVKSSSFPVDPSNCNIIFKLKQHKSTLLGQLGNMVETTDIFFNSCSRKTNKMQVIKGHLKKLHKKVVSNKTEPNDKMVHSIHPTLNILQI
jgi:hypothetical protein